MQHSSRYGVIIVAAGSGTRAGSEIPKQFLPVGGVPLLVHTVRKFLRALPGAAITVCISASEEKRWKLICRDHGLSGTHTVIPGGETRYHSVRNALGSVAGCDLVAVHDGARPFITPEKIRELFDHARAYGSAVPVIVPADSFRFGSEEEGFRPLDRTMLRSVQTPQVFDAKILTDSYHRPFDSAFTDDATVVESCGHPVSLTPGDPANIKITTRADVVLADHYFSRHE